MPEHIFREIRGLIRGHTNRHVDEWKAGGRPVIGYFCHYMPPEIVLAAGALPLRLRAAGSEDSAPGDALMSGRICTFVRHAMSLAIEGEYDFLDGEVTLNTCDHVRRAADVFTKKTDIAFHGFVSVPRNPRENLFAYYLNELKKLRAGIEEHFGVSITHDAMRGAIRAMNENRRRLMRLNELRLGDRPKLSGADALAVHVASMTLPPVVFADLTDRLLEKLEAFDGLDKPGVRLLLYGAELDEPAYVDAIESQGALVVADMLCFGARSVLEPLDEDAADPLETVARAYFFRTSCARMMGDFPRRWENLKTLAQTARADGVVFQRILFCDPWGAELHNLLRRARSENAFPVLSLEREYGIVPTGQVRTRVQAFMEKVEIARAQQAAGISNQ